MKINLRINFKRFISQIYTFTSYTKWLFEFLYKMSINIYL